MRLVLTVGGGGPLYIKNKKQKQNGRLLVCAFILCPLTAVLLANPLTRLVGRSYLLRSVERSRGTFQASANSVRGFGRNLTSVMPVLTLSPLQTICSNHVAL